MNIWLAFSLAAHAVEEFALKGTCRNFLAVFISPFIRVCFSAFHTVNRRSLRGSTIFVWEFFFLRFCYFPLGSLLTHRFTLEIGNFSRKNIHHPPNNILGFLETYYHDSWSTIQLLQCSESLVDRRRQLFLYSSAIYWRWKLLKASGDRETRDISLLFEKKTARPTCHISSLRL